MGGERLDQARDPVLESGGLTRVRNFLLAQLFDVAGVLLLDGQHQVSSLAEVVDDRCVVALFGSLNDLPVRHRRDAAFGE